MITIKKAKIIKDVIKESIHLVGNKTLILILLAFSIGYQFALHQSLRLQPLARTPLFEQHEEPKQHTWVDDYVSPLEHSDGIQHLAGIAMDTFNPFHTYMATFGLEASEPVSFPDLPLFHTWVHFFEAYHNHFARFRGRELVFMEVGVQSGGKIPLLRKYFGKGFKYVGIDINPSTKMFESADWVSIEIGDSADPAFWTYIKEKYAHVDIFLDDGGHTMLQQMVTMREMLPHVQQEGVFVCEDLSTSWSTTFGGIPNGYVKNNNFVDKTMVGLIHRSMDWFMAGAFPGNVMNPTPIDALPNNMFPDDWWKIIPLQVKHIHYYNQLVVYEKGVTHAAQALKTVGMAIPINYSGKHAPVDWDRVLAKIDSFLPDGEEEAYRSSKTLRAPPT